MPNNIRHLAVHDIRRTEQGLQCGFRAHRAQYSDVMPRSVPIKVRAAFRLISAQHSELMPRR